MNANSPSGLEGLFVFLLGLFFKLLCHVFQKLANGKMLGADFFALAAFQALGGFSVVPGEDVVVIIVLIPAFENGLFIVAGEQLRDLDLFGAVVVQHTVVAAGAGDHIHGMEKQGK